MKMKCLSYPKSRKVDTFEKKYDLVTPLHIYILQFIEQMSSDRNLFPVLSVTQETLLLKRNFEF